MRQILKQQLRHETKELGVLKELGLERYEIEYIIHLRNKQQLAQKWN
jgi:hypothetical protein